MNTLGVDIGNLNIKAVLFGESGILAKSMIPAGDEIESQARRALEFTLDEAGLEMDSILVVATGAGAGLASFIPNRKAVATCLARGINYQLPSVRMIIDIGAETSTILKLNERGRMTDWVSHDKCASGTGIFLQQMAKLMGVSIGEMARLSSTADRHADITSTCAVFAESEVISHVHRDPPTAKEEIAAGIYYSVVSRMLTLCKRIGITTDVAVTGGVALNEGLVHILEKELGLEIIRPEAPQMTAALGAAIIAREKVLKG